MAQIMNAGDNELREDVSSTAPKPTKLSVFSERGLALAVAVGLHAAILPWLLTQSPEVPPVSAPQALPMQIEFSVATPVPETPSPASEPQPDNLPATQTPQVDENATTPAPEAKPVEKKLTQAPKAKPPVRPLSKPKHDVRPVQKPAIKPLTPPAPAHAATQSAPRASTVPSSAVAQRVTPPIANAGYLHNPAPDYPESAIERGLEGTVLLRVTVNSAGKATEVQIYQSSGTSALDDAALRTVRRWSFVPAKRGNEAVSGQVIVPVDFSLNS